MKSLGAYKKGDAIEIKPIAGDAKNPERAHNVNYNIENIEYDKLD